MATVATMSTDALIARIIETAADRCLRSSELELVNSQLPGLDRYLGFVYTYIGPDRITAYFDVKDHHKQPMGLVNGGVFASLGESIGTFMAVVATRSICVGVHNSTDFISSVRSGRVEATALPVHLGRSTQLIDVTICQQEKTVARTRLRCFALEATS